MKPETQPESGHTFKTVKEAEANVKVRMEKAVNDLQHDMAAHPHRPRLGQHPR